MSTITPEILKATLEEHLKWAHDEGGKRADLRGADLSGADLSGADLSGADLRGAYLSGADLRGAYLSGADLRGADLRGADLSGADLSGADLRGADLRGAYLSGADLRGADLRRADLSGADLRRADLRGADLRGADLSGADLSGADLSGADLRGAVGIRSYFEQVKADMFAVLATAPTEAPAVLAALEAGKVDGSTYDGECACLVGTMEHAAQNGARLDVLAQIPRDASRLAEVFFQRIRPGDTPSNSPDAALASVWVREFIAQQPAVTATAASLGADTWAFNGVEHTIEHQTTSNPGGTCVTAWIRGHRDSTEGFGETLDQAIEACKNMAAIVFAVAAC